MDNVVVVQVQQSVSDLQCKISLLLVGNVFFFIERNRVKTSTATKLEHDAWIRTIQTDTESLHEIRMRRYTTGQTG